MSGRLLYVLTILAASMTLSGTLRAQFAYVTNTSNSNVSAFTINPSTGALTAVAGSPFSAGADPISVAVDPNGKFVYVADQAICNVLSAFTIGPTGALTAIPNASTGAEPSWVTIDPSGKFVYVANTGDNTVSGYTINPITGVLTATVGSPFAAGSAPGSVAVDPSADLPT